MHRLTPVKSYPIKEGQHEEVIRELGTLTQLVRYGTYFHDAHPTANTPLVNERFAGITSGLRIKIKTNRPL